MGWVRLDDDFYHHRKVIALSLGAKMLFVTGLCYCAENLTDGFVAAGAAKSLTGMLGIRQSAIRELVDASLWHKREDGFEVHDYLQYQPSGADERARRSHLSELRAQAGRRGGKRSAEVRASKSPSKSEANGQANLKQTAQQRGSPDPDPLVVTSPSDLHGWAPDVVATETEKLKAAELVDWLWEVLGRSRHAKHADAIDVVCWAMSYLDGVVVEETIGHLRELTDPPRSARYVATTLRSWGQQRGVEMPEWRGPPSG